MITENLEPTSDSKLVDSALVFPNPATFSGPIAIQTPFQQYNLPSSELNHKAPLGGFSGAVSETVAVPTIDHFVPS